MLRERSRVFSDKTELTQQLKASKKVKACCFQPLKSTINRCLTLINSSIVKQKPEQRLLTAAPPNL